MKSQAPVPTGTPSRNWKTFLGSNVQTARFTSDNGCLTEAVVLSDTRELSTVAYSKDRIDRMLERVR